MIFALLLVALLFAVWVVGVSLLLRAGTKMQDEPLNVLFTMWTVLIAACAVLAVRPLLPFLG